MFDTIRIEQVLRNLLSNAIKFSVCGSEISVEVESNKESVVITVMDRGPGIPADELEIVFDKFSQSSTTRDGSGGTGLGLPICREIITAHQGRIYARNNSEAGASFVFTIPYDLPLTADVEQEILVSNRTDRAA